MKRIEQPRSAGFPACGFRRLSSPRFLSSRNHTELESSVNPQTGMSALRIQPIRTRCASQRRAPERGSATSCIRQKICFEHASAFSLPLLLKKGGEGRGEEALHINFPSLRLSPRSFLAGRERQNPGSLLHAEDNSSATRSSSHFASFSISCVVASVLFSGCAVGPNYKAPHTTVAGPFANSPTNAVLADEATLATWWKGFNDARLDGLVDRAIAHNHDLRIATANLKEARALRRLTTFDLAPTVQGNAGYQNGLLSKSAALPGASRGAREFELYDASFDSTWELDLFGHVRRSVQAANAQFAAAEATRLDVLGSVTAEVARNYLELRGLQNQLAVALKNADVQAETLKITQSRLEGGRGTDFDVSRSRSLLNLTLSTIPPLEVGIQKTIHR